MTTPAPDPGISCPDCGRVFATMGNITHIPCVPCAYKRLDRATETINLWKAWAKMAIEKHPDLDSCAAAPSKETT